LVNKETKLIGRFIIIIGGASAFGFTASIIMGDNNNTNNTNNNNNDENENENDVDVDDDDSVPTVSLELYENDFNKFVECLGESYEKYGFVILEDHSVSLEEIERAFETAKKFFCSLTKEQKEKYFLQGQGGARGYTSFGKETAKGALKSDLKEFFHYGRDLKSVDDVNVNDVNDVNDEKNKDINNNNNNNNDNKKLHKYSSYMPPNVKVEEVPEFTESARTIFLALDELGNKVLQALAVYLKQDRYFFDDKVDEGNSILRIIHYPPIEKESAGHVRAGAHEDINLITLLLGADEGGLQILRKDGKWLDVNPPPGCVTCNIGDMLQRLTNHVLPSTTHRVVNPPNERAHIPRFSMPYFLHPNPDYVIETLESCVSEERPNLYPEPICSDDYLQLRLKEIKLK
jgi:isopenicillin N synthase-like dioxygenase